MADSPVTERLNGTNANYPRPSTSFKLEIPPVDSSSQQTPPTTVAAPAPPPPPPPPPLTFDLTPSSDADLIHIPSYSRWFSWNNIHDCELRFLPEFFDSRCSSKNPKVYKYLRNSIVQRFRDNPSSKITFTDVRKTLVGDVGSIRRVFDFLEAWGLINYSPSTVNKPLKWEDKETKSTSSVSHGEAAAVPPDSSSAPSREVSKRVCNGCKSNCSIACFACDKYDLTLCARCYVRGNYRVGVTSSDFRRVEISEDMRTDWTDKETLHLLEAAMHFGDDWKKIAQHVGGRSEKECVTHFVKLPFGEQFISYPESVDNDDKHIYMKDHGDANFGSVHTSTISSSKRIRLTPLADASNPIMAQAAFLSALAGVEVAEASARAAVAKLSEIADVDGGTGSHVIMGDYGDVKLEVDLERAISEIIDVQMKEMQDKLDSFEDLDLQLEKERQQFEQVKNILFADRLNLIFNKSSDSKTAEDNIVRIDL